MLLAALTSLGPAACTTEVGLLELDGLNRASGARTIVVEDELSLYSPYPPVATRPYVELVRAQRAEVFALFGVDGGERVVVQLRPNEGLGARVTVDDDSVTVEARSGEPEGGVRGSTGAGLVTIEVDPHHVVRLAGGREITGGFDASTYAGTVRHELAHVATACIGVSGDDWLLEGIAHAVQWLPAEDGRLRLEPPPRELVWAAQLPRERRSLAALLAWRQALPPTDDDRAARLLAFSLVAFALEREQLPARAGALYLAALDDSEVRALEVEWSRWLDRVAGQRASGTSSRSPSHAHSVSRNPASTLRRVK